MKVVVRVDHRAPVAVHMVLGKHRVGSMDESNGKREGCAHVLEHMMFKETGEEISGRESLSKTVA